MSRNIDTVLKSWEEIMLKKIRPDFVKMSATDCTGAAVFDMVRKHLRTMTHEQLLDIAGTLISVGLAESMDRCAAEKRVKERPDETKTTSA